MGTTKWMKVSIIMFLTACFFCTTAFVSKSNLYGTWYIEGDSDPWVTLYSDGTCEIYGEYGSGVWSIVNSDTLKITDFYGQTGTYRVVSANSGELQLDQYGNTINLYDHYVAIEEPPFVPEVSILRVCESASDYKEGFAWIDYMEYEQKTNKYGGLDTTLLGRYFGCIDKNGNVVFKIPLEENNVIEDCTGFTNGFMHVIVQAYAGSRVFDEYVINNSGELLRKIEYDATYTDKDSFINLVGYGDGLSLYYEEVAGFSAVEGSYYLLDAYGNKIDTFTIEDNAVYRREGQYCGQGVFQWDNGEHLYSANAKEHSRREITDFIHFADGNLAAEPLSTYIDYNIHFIDYDLNEYTINTESLPKYEFVSEYTTLVGGKCVVVGNKNEIYVCNTDTMTIEQVEGKYLDRFNGYYLFEGAYFTDGCIAVPLFGADENHYVCFYDENWNALTEPIPCDDYIPGNNGRFIVRNQNTCRVFNSRGEEVFNVADLGYDCGCRNYSDDVALIDYEYSRNYYNDPANIRTPVYLDLEGSPIFDDINYECDKILQDAGSAKAVSEEKYDPLFFLHTVGDSDEAAHVDTALEAEQDDRSVITSVAGSSTLNNYIAEYAIDNDPRTAWFEGTEGVGLGEYLTFSVDAEQIEGISILPGYTKNSAVYSENAVPELFLIESGKNRKVLDLSGYVPAFADLKAWSCTFDTPFEVVDGTIDVIILSSKKGTKSEHTGISEISFY